MTRLTLRPMTRADLPLMSHWLAAPHVHAWWGDNPAPDSVESEYGPSLDGTDPARLRIALQDGRPVGFIQWYAMSDEPEYVDVLSSVIPILDGDMSLDYLIGEADALGHGAAAVMIRLAADEIWHDVPSAHRIIVPVHATNRASWRSLENAGFRRIAEGELEPDFATDDHRHVLYSATRSKVAE
ncbi:GNAT family N-acetyltransferase [Herbiconiux sp. L3-i23]|uniref:GNAT family N-acetyltransferase n=1 Tax=Herbiconiux sp. L3-i23 TaxID=2905871 RepID=UPI00204FEE4A|nr:GNAT family N-acetyltransferase [Herbiconiux sp. L3-i23]BDI23155.1 aminoglycoside N(6')-acetyltransferase [Herbiconiux sp. L3-i23]